MTTVIGLDLSLTATGLAWWRDGTVHVTTVRTYPVEHDHNGWSAPLRHRRIMAKVMDVVGEPDTLVSKEDRLNSLEVAGNSALDIAGLHAVCDYALASRRVPIAKINLRHIKQYATGNGNADKPAMLAAAVAAFEPMLVANDNEADALWALAMAMHKYGLPLFAVPTVRAIKLDKVRWPVWSGLQDHHRRVAAAPLGGTS